MLVTERQKATLEEFENLPEKAPFQLIGGELVMSPSPILIHQEIIGNLYEALRAHCRKHDLGRVILSPIDLRLGDDDVYQPDLAFVRKENVPKLDPRERLNIIPDLVIEVLSPSTAYHDFTRKKAKYCEAGVREYWIVDPMDETVEIMVKDGTYYRTGALIRKPAPLVSGMFPGFTMPVKTVFAF